MRRLRRERVRWMIPVLLMAAITPLTPSLDLKIANYFYHLETQEKFVQNPVVTFIYMYGPLPGQIAMTLAMGGALLSFIFPKCKSWRPYTLFVFLTLSIGGGLITHAVLKDHWGRPRPKQVIEFGGTQPFRPYYKPNFFHQPEPSKSFPCGHCTMGFLFLSFVLLGVRLKRRWLTVLGVMLTLLLTSALAYARMSQGGHFLSDILMSGLVMWLTAVAIEPLVFKEIS